LYLNGEPELIYKKNFKQIGLSSGNNYLSGVKKKCSMNIEYNNSIFLQT